MKNIAPTGQQERILVFDSLRGIAILGILLVNIRGFGLPFPAIDNPTVTDDLSGVNYYAWFINECILDGGFRSLLSMLFGAGMLLFIQHAEKRIDKAAAAGLLFRRQGWLLVFGIINMFFFLWFWDILSMYAVCGMVLFTFRHLSISKLFIAAAICLLVTDTFETAKLYRKKEIIYKGETVIRANASVADISASDLQAVNEYQDLLYGDVLPMVKENAAREDIHKTTGGWMTLYDLHIQRGITTQVSFFTFYFWDIMLFMFIGMAFYKLGILTGDAPVKFYWMLALPGLAIGLFLSWLRVRSLVSNNFDEYLIARNSPVMFYETARCFRSIGFFGVVMLIYKAGTFKKLFRFLQPVGQMAFSNYLLQSILCGLFFYGIGFGMFGKLERIELYYVVAAVWLLQIGFCHIWLRFFYYGPFEWIWRSLTYWQKQPMIKEKNS